MHPITKKQKILYIIAAAVFVLLVNVSIPFAQACTHIPVLGWLAQAVCFSHSLSSAVEHDWVQKVEQTQRDNGYTLTLEDLIVDQKQIHLFYTLDWEDPACEYAMVLVDGERLSPRPSVLSDSVQGPQDAGHIVLDYREEQVPDRLDLELTVRPNGDGSPAARFRFQVALDPSLTAVGQVRPVDAAMANDKPFINVSGTGFDVDVIINTEKFKKRFNGMLPYMLGIFQSLMHLKPVTFEITADGESFTERALLFNACNGTHFAGGMHVAPMASPYDGLLDVCILRAISIPQFLLLLPRYTRGAHTASRHVRYFKAKEIAVRCDSENIINLDGELDSSTPVTFKVLPGAIKLALPGEKGNK